MKNNNVNFQDVIEEIQRLRGEWEGAGLRDGVLVSEVVIQALKEKFLKTILTDTAKGLHVRSNPNLEESPDVWVVIRPWDYTMAHVEGIYLSEEDAKEKVKQLKDEKEDNSSSTFMEKWTVE